ncbi:MAG: DegV family protein [Candidatus Heimdallarchaeota archaeon]|nr:DegV family protein [Candidatus Heimdallarchaeota archaeon]
MTKIGIVSDATCDLPIELIKKYDIGIVPVNVIFNETEIRQPYVDLTNEEFYQRLESGENASTGVPAPGVVKEHLIKFLEKYDELIFITLSSKLSAMFQTAQLVVKQEFSDKVTAIDSRSGTIQTGLIVLIAARAVAENKNRQEIVDYLTNEIIPNTHLISYAATLKYLRRGGRISRLTHLMGKMLNIKPIFHIDNRGEILSPGKIMLWQNIEVAFKKLLKNLAGSQKIETIFIAHSGNPEKCQELIDYLKTIPQAPKEILMAEVGPAVGVHVGPNTFGFVWIGDYNENWFSDL